MADLFIIGQFRRRSQYKQQFLLEVQVMHMLDYDA